MFEEIKKIYKNKTGNELDLNMDMKLTYEQERYSDGVILKNVTFSDRVTDRAIYTLGKIIYKNMLAQRKVGVL